MSHNTKNKKERGRDDPTQPKNGLRRVIIPSVYQIPEKARAAYRAKGIELVNG